MTVIHRGVNVAEVSLDRVTSFYCLNQVNHPEVVTGCHNRLQSQVFVPQTSLSNLLSLDYNNTTVPVGAITPPDVG